MYHRILNKSLGSIIRGFFNSLTMSSKITINGKSYHGNNITIRAGRVIVDGKDETPDEKDIKIQVEGNIQTLDVERCSTISVYGDVNSLKNGAGDVTCGSVKNGITSGAGDVQCGDVVGDIHGGAGDIIANNVTGSVKTGAGDIRIKSNTGTIKM